MYNAVRAVWYRAALVHEEKVAWYREMIKHDAEIQHNQGFIGYLKHEYTSQIEQYVARAREMHLKKVRQLEAEIAERRGRRQQPVKLTHYQIPPSMPGALSLGSNPGSVTYVRSPVIQERDVSLNAGSSPSARLAVLPEISGLPGVGMAGAGHSQSPPFPGGNLQSKTDLASKDHVEAGDADQLQSDSRLLYGDSERPVGDALRKTIEAARKESKERRESLGSIASSQTLQSIHAEDAMKQSSDSPSPLDTEGSEVLDKVLPSTQAGRGASVPSWLTSSKLDVTEGSKPATKASANRRASASWLRP